MKLHNANHKQDYGAYLTWEANSGHLVKRIWEGDVHVPLVGVLRYKARVGV